MPNIKAVIQNVGPNMAHRRSPVDSVSRKRPKLRGRRVLVVDPQDEVRTSAHSLLEPYGCVVTPQGLQPSCSSAQHAE
jgi:hypothetical protein